MLSCAALQRAFGDRLGGVRRLQGLAALVDDLFGDSAGLDQVQAAVEVALGKLGLGARIRKLAVSLLRDGFEGAEIDHIEQVPGCTMSPSLNSTLVTKPPTRART